MEPGAVGIDFFSPNEAAAISSIRLSTYVHVDTLVWSGERSGIYSVLSDYKHLRPSTSLSNDEQVLFKQIWALLCPSKVRINLWKLSNNYIPTKANLCYKRIATDPLCPRCHLDAEGIKHIILIAHSLMMNKFYHDGISQSVEEVFTFVREGDLKTVIKKLQSNSIDRSEISALICEAQGFASNFLQFIFSFVPRSGNKVTDAVVALGRSENEDRFWIKEALHRRLNWLLVTVAHGNLLSGFCSSLPWRIHIINNKKANIQARIKSCKTQTKGNIGLEQKGINTQNKA
ncbi:hypothetical protein GQ457_14G018510 [Hibiscus cannabinus]